MIDAESAFRDWLADRYEDTEIEVVTEIPPEITGPILRILRVGGPTVFVLDKPLFAIDSLDVTRDAARTLAVMVHNDVIFELPGQQVGDAYVSKVECPSGPAWRAHGKNTNVRRFGATYRLFIR